MSEFNLRHLVQSVCDTSTLTDPDALAKEVLSQIAKEDEHAALEQAIGTIVRKFVSADQRKPLISPGGQGEADSQGRGAAGGSNRSRKVAAIRNNWQTQLSARVNVGAREWKFFGDCTLDDLNFMATHRRQLAASNFRIAKNLDSLGQLLIKHSVSTVREIPEGDAVELGEAA